MSYSEIKIYHLKDYIEYVSELGVENDWQLRTPPVLWFRGERRYDWSLRPSLIRKQKLNQADNKMGVASERALQEELRYQHYLAKNYHFLSKNPETRLGWLELMQHHGVETRLLDWSESMVHPLIFALECFFDAVNCKTEERISSSPNIWVFEPIKWNRIVLEKLLKSNNVIDYCLNSLQSYGCKRIGKVLQTRLKNLSKMMPDYIRLSKTGHLENIFNLSAIENDLKKLAPDELRYLLEQGEYYYCLFYILKQTYLTSMPWNREEVMPLAIVESYHSERIRAQKGAFTIFPYYKEDEKMVRLQKVNIFLDGMENMYPGNQYLHRIRICNQEEIAFEIMNAGMNISWLYPEMPVVANSIENRKVIY